MPDFLVIGSLFGAVIGLFHAAVDFRRRIRIASSTQSGETLTHLAKAIYAALWIFALWTIFGFYVLALWIISAVLYALLGRLRSAAKPITVH